MNLQLFFIVGVYGGITPSLLHTIYVLSYKLQRQHRLYPSLA